MASKKISVLIVDDEQVVCEFLVDELSERGYLCTTALDGNAALAQLGTGHFDVVLLDIRLPGISGMEVLREVLLRHGNIGIIMVTAINDVDTAVEAMKLGASDYIVKPFDPDAVDASIRGAAKTRRTLTKHLSEMDAIASGVEVLLDPYLGYSEMVTQKTVDIARRLGIDEEQIQTWSTEKTKLDSTKIKVPAS